MNGQGPPLPSSFDVQHQVRQNAEELNDFMRGFSAWQKEMKKKDQQLLEASKQKRSSSGGDQQEEGKPPRRKLSSPPPPNSISPLKKDSKGSGNGGSDGDAAVTGVNKVSSKGETSVTSKPKSVRIKSGEYDKWDRYDADQAALEVDQEKKPRIEEIVDERRPTPSSSSTVDKQQAVAEKDRGNEFFKAEKYEEAIECYTRGIKCDPSNAILPANRAMALLKKGRNKEAAQDCTLAIGLDPTYLKAYQRRAAARTALKQHSQAIKDYEKVLQLEPNNKQAKAEITKLGNALKTEEEKAKAATTEEVVKSVEKKATAVELDVKENLKSGLFKEKPKIPGQVFPIDKKPHLRSKKPLRRIEITEVGSGAAKADEQVKTAAAPKADEGSFLIRESKTRPVASSLSSSSAATQKSMPQQQKKKTRLQIEEISSSETKVEEEKEKVTQKADEKAPPSKSTGQVRQVEDDILQLASSMSKPPEKSQPKDGVGVAAFKKANSSMQFYSQWRALSSADQKWDFLDFQMKTVGSYSSLFSHSMESDVFEDIVEVLHAKTSGDVSGNSAVVLRHLQGLSSVPRMSALVIFMDNKSKLQELVKKHVVDSKSQLLQESQVNQIVKCFQ